MCVCMDNVWIMMLEEQVMSLRGNWSGDMGGDGRQREKSCKNNTQA